MFKVAENYLNDLRKSKSRKINSEETEKIQNAISNLYSIRDFPLTALELASEISEEDVSEVFVRINSAGTPLDQTDFILTLMSVFWDEGRSELEKFCRDSRKPAKNFASPFNHFIEPSPDQLLRVNIGVAFKRARMRYAYSILRGKDLETGQFSEERRIKQFDILKKAQTCTLNPQYWHDFMNCIRAAGFRNKKMIRSQNNLLFSYMLYLIGRTEYGVDAVALQKVIAQWFFMSAVTSRFTSSPESTMESDLARLRGATRADEFVDILQQVCDITLTNDFWKVTLPNDLATSSSSSPSLSAYHASLVLLSAPILFSSAKLSDSLDPTVKAVSSAWRHRLFPKDYLEKLGISGTRETNQIANYAHMDRLESQKVANQPPMAYLRQLKKGFTKDEVDKMYSYHALPKRWERMKYGTFLKKRRELMAKIIHDGYIALTSDVKSQDKHEMLDLETALAGGESDAVEYKSTLRINLHTGSPDKKMEFAVLKTLAGFLNTNGGTLYIGVSDDGTPLGIETDNFANGDKMSLHLINIGKGHMNESAMSYVHPRLEDYKDHQVLAVRCEQSPDPVYVKYDKEGKDKRFYIRLGPSTQELPVDQIHNYIKNHFE